MAFSVSVVKCFHDKWIPVTKAWRVLKVLMEEQPSIWRIAANILNKQSRTAGKRWSFRLEIGKGIVISLP